MRAPLAEHGRFEPAASRDPVGLLLDQARSRVPELVPVRHGRMLASPFSYFRGAALPMAADLATTPTSGLRVQLCGDAHLSNFGVFASPERRLMFDINDFDETLPGPFEWDVKRLAASLAVAGRELGLSAKQRRKMLVASVQSYRTAIREFAGQPFLTVWYAHVDVEQALAQFQTAMSERNIRRTEAALAKARTRDSTQALAKLTTTVDGRRRIISDPPLVVPVEELFSSYDEQMIYARMGSILSGYRRSLQSDRQHLLDQFRVTHLARKVVGVGSVGTLAWILLLETSSGDPLFLQAKEAQPSVLAPYAGRSRYGNHGQRVVAGQRLMQATSDIFLGWQRITPESGPPSVDYYVRQLRDWKFSADVAGMDLTGITRYGMLCGWTLARAHARSGDRLALAAYLGKSDTFDQAVADFAEAYADQNERDYAALGDAVRSGRVEAQMDV